MERRVALVTVVLTGVVDLLDLFVGIQCTVARTIVDTGMDTTRVDYV